MKDLLLFYSANYQLLKNFITKNNLFLLGFIQKNTLPLSHQSLKF